MRVVALGTGMPNARPKQAAACWLVELGNGDKFLFDIGTGSAERLSAMKIPMDYLDKLFIGHLHSDQVGDFDALWIGGNVANRMVPLRVWGPSGHKPEFGTKYFVEKLREAYTWDIGSREGNKDTRGLALKVTEFDYKQENVVVYEENGVVIKSFPAIHALDGSISYTLEWKGLKFAYSSDTYPNKWWMEFATDADIAIHECFAPPKVLVEKQKFPPGTALNVGTQVHTSPAQFGKVMSMIKPRLAVGYHFFNDYDTAPLVLEQVRETYDGPLALATDYMVFNVDKNGHRVRMAAIDEDIWPQPSTIPQQPPDFSKAIGFSDYITGGRVNFQDVIEKLYSDINKEYGTNIPPPR
jgi:ribonuclease Z